MQNLIKFFFKVSFAISFCLVLGACGGGFKMPKPGDARTMEMEGEERARKNVEEGRGFSVKRDMLGGRKTTYEFSTSNPLWRATFDVIDFMPLVTVDYSGGMIVTDWYTDSNTSNDSLKFTIRFLSNEIRADALEIKLFSKKCGLQSNCKITENNGQIVKDIKKKILKKAAIYEKEFIKKNKKKYLGKIR